MAKRTSKPKAKEPVAQAPLPPDSELLTLINEDTGETRQVVVRLGYAPAPMPFGFRLATEDEIAGTA